MIKISAAIAALLSGFNLALAGPQSGDFDSLSLKAPELRASGEIKVPVPENPVKGTEVSVYHTIRMCSYMFASAPGGADGVGVFAFDLNSEGKACEIPTFHGKVYGAYRCHAEDTETARTSAGGLALLFLNRHENGASLYHQLNVQQDFAAMSKFRGTMKITGGQPEDLSKPLQPNAGGVYQLSCKMESVAFVAD